MSLMSNRDPFFGIGMRIIAGWLPLYIVHGEIIVHAFSLSIGLITIDLLFLSLFSAFFSALDMFDLGLICLILDNSRRVSSRYSSNTVWVGPM